MSLLEKINSAFQRKAQTAKEKYIAAIRSGDDAKILPAAEAAGITPTKIQEDAAILDKAAELAPIAEQFPSSQKALAEAQQQLAAAQAKLEKTVAPLKQSVDEAANAVRAAAANVYRIKPAVGKLHSLYSNNVELLDAEKMPQVVRDLFAAIAAESKPDPRKLVALKQFDAARRSLAAARLNMNAVAGGKLPPNHEAAAGLLAKAEAEYADAIEGMKKVGIQNPEMGLSPLPDSWPA